MSLLTRVADFVSAWFAVLVLAGLALGLVAPDATTAVAPHIPLLLGLIMFGMGLTLRPVDFRVVATHPLAVVTGVLAQFTVMPLLGWAIGAVLGLPPELALGLVLVGAAPGGTASNVVVYLARGDVALSVAMTSISTLLAPLLTPLLILWLAGSLLPVEPGALFTSIVQIVLVPVAAGLALRAAAPRLVERALPVLPLVSVVGIVAVVAAVVGASREAVLSGGLLVLLAVVLHNGLGLALGYGIGRVTGLPESARRAVSVEVGMQNSGLAAALATVHFTPLSAVPAALFSVWHNISGATVATFWARRPVPAQDGEVPAGPRAGSTR